MVRTTDDRKRGRYMLTLYELSGTYRQLLELDLEEDDMILALNSLEGDIKEKANNIGKVINSLQGEQLVLENEIKRLQAKLSASKAKETNIKQYLSDNLESMGIQKLECELFKYSFRKSTSLQIDDASLIPEDYKEKVVTEKINKSLIKKAFKYEPIPGCSLLEKHNLQVK